MVSSRKRAGADTCKQICSVLYPLGDQFFWGTVAARKGVALKPVAVDEVIVSPPPLKLIVVPPLLANVTGVTVGVFNVFVVPLKLIVPPVQLDTFIPVLVPVEERLPDKVIVPPVML